MSDRARARRGGAGRRAVRARIVTQSLVFAAFVLLTFVPALHSGGEWLFRVDASSILLAAISSHRLTLSILFVLALLVVTLTFGRVFCGWVCPLGTLGDALDAVLRLPTRGGPLRVVKYYLLGSFLVLGLVGYNFAWWLDPMGWASRMVSLIGPSYVDVAAASTLLVVFVGLHVAFGRRAFCRVLCPLGAGLGLVARLSTLRRRFRGKACIDCDLCVDHNRSFAIRPRPENYDPMECFQCRECEEVCPTDALRFEYVRKRKDEEGDVVHVPLSRLRSSSRAHTGDHRANPPLGGESAPQLSRRALFGSLAAGALGAAILRAREAAATPEALPPIRPPGSVEEDTFTSLCIRCTACIRACPTGTLRPAGLAQGLAGYRAPLLSARDGGCLHGCNDCGQVCPTGAIAPIPLAEKQKLRLGLAAVDEDRCLPIKKGKPCLSCSAACPYEAIELEPVARTPHGVGLLSWGDWVARPRILEVNCTGCGLCEAACPVEGAAAIRVTAARRQAPMPAPLEERPFQSNARGVFRLNVTESSDQD